MATPSAPACSVVICTRDRPALLDRCLTAVSRLQYDRLDVLVVDNAPTTPETRHVAARREARYLVEPVGGLSRARNRGARAAGGEIVAYLDDDSVPEPGWLTHLVPAFDYPEVMAAAGRILPLGVKTGATAPGTLDRGAIPRVVDRTHPFWFELATFGGLGSGGNMAFRRQVFSEWPGFDERLGRGAPIGAGEDYHAFFSLLERGYRVSYAPRAVVHHPNRPDPEAPRSRYLSDVAASMGYMTSLFVERPGYRARLLRYFTQRLAGAARPWRPAAGRPALPLVGPRRLALARLAGVLLYFRSQLAA